MEFERCNSSLKSHLFLAASAAEKFTMMIRLLQLVTSGGITIFRTMQVIYVYHSQINVKFDFWPKQLH